MTLALRMFFWDSPAWVPGPPAPTPIIPAESRGGGHRKNNNKDYQPLSDAYWKARELFLKPKPKLPPPRPAPIDSGATPPFTGTLTPTGTSSAGLDDVDKLKAYLAQLALQQKSP